VDLNATGLIIALVSQRLEALQGFVKALEENDRCEVQQVGEVGVLHTVIREKKPQLVVLDCEFAGRGAMSWAKEIMSIDAMITTACLGNMPAEVFHEKSEGLGMLGQYPLHPKENDAHELFTTFMELRLSPPS
jgi:hypothetical protein